MSRIHQHNQHASSPNGLPGNHMIGHRGGEQFANNLLRIGHPSSGQTSDARNHDCSDSTGPHTSPTTGSQPSQSASTASQLLGLVADAKTPEDKAALVTAAISMLKGDASQGDSQSSGKLLKILGDLTHNIDKSSGPSDPGKSRILDGIANIVKQIASPANQQGSSRAILDTLNQLVQQISHASGLDQATKNGIIDKLTAIIQELPQTSSGSSSHSGTGGAASNADLASSGD